MSASWSSICHFPPWAGCRNSLCPLNWKMGCSYVWMEIWYYCTFWHPPGNKPKIHAPSRKFIGLMLCHCFNCRMISHICRCHFHLSTFSSFVAFSMCPMTSSRACYNYSFDFWNSICRSRSSHFHHHLEGTFRNILGSWHWDCSSPQTEKSHRATAVSDWNPQLDLFLRLIFAPVPRSAFCSWPGSCSWWANLCFELDVFVAIGSMRCNFQAYLVLRGSFFYCCSCSILSNRWSQRRWHQFAVPLFFWFLR